MASHSRNHFSPRSQTAWDLKFSSAFLQIRLGFFVGPKGKNIRNHIVAKSISQYKEKNNIEDDINIPIFVQIRHPDEENPSVHAVIEVAQDHGHIIPFIEEAIGKHHDFFLKYQEKRENQRTVESYSRQRRNTSLIKSMLVVVEESLQKACRDCQDAVSDITQEN